MHANDNVIQNSNYKYAYQSADIISTYPKPLFTDVNLAVEENIVSKLVQQKNQYLFDVKKASTCFLKANGKVITYFELNVSDKINSHICSQITHSPS